MASKAPSTLPATRTPIERTDSTTTLKINAIISALSKEWSLGLDTIAAAESPDKRTRSIEEECFCKIRFLCYKKSIDEVLVRFDTEAHRLYKGWVLKPKAERGVIPVKTRTTRKPVTAIERSHLLQCLLDTLNPEYQRVKLINGGSPASVRNRSRGLGEVTYPHLNLEPLDDSPVPFKITPKPRSDTKRLPEISDFANSIDSSSRFKKPKLPKTQTTSTSTSHLASSRNISLEPLPNLPQPWQLISPSSQRKIRSTEASANTSFATTSFTSVASSVFSRDGNIPSMTQSTVDNGDLMDFGEKGKAQENKQTQSTQYSSPGADLADLLGLDLGTSTVAQNGNIASGHILDLLELESVAVSERGETTSGVPSELRSRTKKKLWSLLQNTFPPLPTNLLSLPLCVRYEITRIILYAECPLSSIAIPSTLQYQTYDDLWIYLKSLPCLQNKTLPPRCNPVLWSLALQDDRLASRGILQAGTLRYNHSPHPDSLFKLTLKPLKLELTHRLDRRFGCGRFLELDIPDLGDYKRPTILKNLHEEGIMLVRHWLLDAPHSFLGRTWRPFFTRPLHPKAAAKSKKKKAAITEKDGGVTNRINFFAVDGHGFGSPDGVYDRLATLFPSSRCEVKDLIQYVIPLGTSKENGSQPFLKLFSRISLVLSRNSPTILLEKSQIKFSEDIKSGREVMSDGAGRISPRLAEQVALNLGLRYVPTGFQARIGSAKGFWCIDYSDKTDLIWIKCYESQCKWKMDDADDHPSNRTFEVIQPSKPLKPANLNLQFLPLLEDRAEATPESRDILRATIARRLTSGIDRETDGLNGAIKDPLLLREYIWEYKLGCMDRLRTGMIPFVGGLPGSIEDRINMLLDAGFEAPQCNYLCEQVLRVSKQRFSDLKKRLNVPISESTNAYMVPDFSGCLEEGEVSLHFSNFDDYSVGIAPNMLEGVDVLVTRNPAHYQSDIQKVRAVYKPELQRYKDVIFFSTKGKISLASKLSGGDFDGDKAWVCWDSEIVDHFVNVDVPKCPDLIKKGFVSKNSMTFEQLVRGSDNPISIFLDHSFLFSMQRSPLGPYTKDKEKLCYHHRTVCSKEAIELSTFLSLFVDAAKGGYAITEEGRKRIQKMVRGMRTPAYEDERLDRNSNHIIDHLRVVGHDTIEAALTQMHERYTLQAPPHMDRDLTRLSETVEKHAKTVPEYEALLAKLKPELQLLRDVWSFYWSQDENKRIAEDVFIAGLHERYQDISPSQGQSSLRRWILPDSMREADGPTEWALLKASVLYDMYTKTAGRTMVWRIAGRHLCWLKGRYSGGGEAMVVAARMYAFQKPNGMLIRILKGVNGCGGLGFRVMERVERDDDDDDDDDDDNDDDDIYWDGDQDDELEDALLGMLDM